MKGSPPDRWSQIGWAAALGVALLLPVLLTTRYQMTLASNLGMYVLLAVGLNFIYGYAGQMAFCHAAFWGIGAYASAIFATKFAMNFWVGMAAAAVVTLLVALALGAATLRLKFYYFGLATMGAGEIIHTVIVNWENVTGGVGGITRIPPPTLFGHALSGEKEFYYFWLAFALIGIFVAHRIEKSRFGRSLIAIREGESSAEAMGVPAFSRKLLALCLSAIYASVAGSIFASQTAFISPESFTTHTTITFVLMVIVGGRGSLPGITVGAIVLSLLPELLRGLKQYYMLLYGIAIVVLIIVWPNGLGGALSKLSKQVRSIAKGGAQP
ncbi:MAG: putative high-affinity branched-chain amino acid transporter, permease protein [Firmicutes bacterium]|jgi:branched-chain amino acid transport system permease protein|nr:putative high-affinity branched-chain amino acid transporter, permease protein [Bacillota bacterium]